MDTFTALVGQAVPSTSPGVSTFVAVFGAIAVALTTLIGLVTAITGLIKLVHRSKDAPPAPVDDVAHEARAWQETLEQLDAANDRADRTEREARVWRDKYVALLEGRTYLDTDPPSKRRPRR